MDLTTLPDWFSSILVGTIFAALGYFAKGALDERKRRSEKRVESLQRLKRLDELLRLSGQVYKDQNAMARRLWGKLSERIGPSLDAKLGFDEVFHQAFEQMTPDERELHGMIRGTSKNSLRQANEMMQQWLTEDSEFKRYDGVDDSLKLLAPWLRHLEQHLALWHDKLQGVLLEDPKRSLVYLGDEKRHGKEFPHGIEAVVQTAIKGFAT